LNLDLTSRCSRRRSRSCCATAKAPSSRRRRATTDRRAWPRSSPTGALNANATYTATVSGAKDLPFNPGDFTNGPLTGVGNFAATPNGVFLYGAGGGFPSGSYGGSNYWVDVLFVPAG